VDFDGENSRGIRGVLRRCRASCGRRVGGCGRKSDERTEVEEGDSDELILEAG
jgi:hypothetical protein